MRPFWIVLFLFPMAILFGEENFGGFAVNYFSLFRQPSEMSFRMLETDGKGKIRRSTMHTRIVPMEAENRLLIESVSDGLRQTVVMSGNASYFSNETRYFQNDVIRQMKHDFRVSVLDQGLLRNRIYMTNALVKERSLKLKSDAVLFDVLPYRLQSLLNEGKTNAYTCNAAFSFGFETRVLLSYREARSLSELSPEFEKFEELSSLFAQGEPLAVYVMSLAGPEKVFYPHCFYFAFKKNKRFEYAGYWGGDPKKAPSLMVKI